MSDSFWTWLYLFGWDLKWGGIKVAAGASIGAALGGFGYVLYDNNGDLNALPRVFDSDAVWPTFLEGAVCGAIGLPLLVALIGWAARGIASQRV